MERIIKIEQKSKYTELSKYYKYSFEKFEKVFKQRHLDWDYYKQEAIDMSNKGGMWRLSMSDVLTDRLKDYDHFIRRFYNEKIKSMSIKEIYLEFYKNNNLTSLKFKNN